MNLLSVIITALQAHTIIRQQGFSVANYALALLCLPTDLKWDFAPPCCIILKAEVFFSFVASMILCNSVLTL